MRVIYVPGVFDLLHRGHLNLLMRAREMGELLVVGVVSDSGVHAYKGRFPAENVQKRMTNIERLGFVDVVVMQDTTDPTRVLERFMPDALVHGDDWQRLLEGNETLERLGVEFVTVPYTPGISTTQLRAVSA